MKSSVADLKEGQRAIVVGLAGGSAFQRKLRSMGIREGQAIHLVSRQPFGGPLVIEVNGRQITAGRGMSLRIMVDR